jgi:hypothetical protein
MRRTMAKMGAARIVLMTIVVTMSRSSSQLTGASTPSRNWTIE